MLYAMIYISNVLNIIVYPGGMCAMADGIVQVVSRKICVIHLHVLVYLGALAQVSVYIQMLYVMLLQIAQIGMSHTFVNLFYQPVLQDVYVCYLLCTVQKIMFF